MRRAALLRAHHALSPYAQALRQVALQGAVALGPSARERELALHRRGTLQADYRPPVQGQWDDTIERWAYAWQYPALEHGTSDGGGEDEHDDHDDVAAVTRNRGGFARLLSFCAKLAQTPPSTRPGSGVHSTRYGVVDAAATTAALSADATDTALLTSTTAASSSPPPLLLPASSSSSATTVDFAHLQASLQALHTSEEATTVAAASASEEAARMMPAEQYAREVGVPVAYLDDQSERSRASRELHAVLDDVGLDYTEDGLIVAVTALSRQQHDAAARALFDFACDVGLGPNAELYKALMTAPAARGDVNAVMSLIEQMKQRGITPRIGNWHVLMRAFYVARDFAAVSQIVDNMKMYANIEPNERTFVLQLRALAKDTTQQNALAEAVQLFDQMEHVYGYIAARPHYDALMYALSHSPAPEMRLRCEELAQKMRLMGMTWNGTTFLNLIRAAQLVGDVAAVERLLARMRDERVPMTMLHLAWAVHAHTQHLLRLDYDALKAPSYGVRDDNNNDDGSSGSSAAEQALLTTWLDHMNVCFGIYELVVQRRWQMQLPLLNALLRLCCQLTILATEHMPDRVDVIGRFEEHATRLWRDAFDDWGLARDVYSYECYVALLAHQQRIDEAEALFQRMVLQCDWTPTRRTYECLLFMHLSSGEEGGAARALRYLDAMEQARLPVRASLLRKIVRVHDAAGYRRDMKRRARRIMQAREEYLARKAEQSSPPSPEYADMDARDEATSVSSSSSTSYAVPSDDRRRSNSNNSDDNSDNDGDVPAPLPLRHDSTLAWWVRWKQQTMSKHELFDDDCADGTPRGERFDEKNTALAKLGITSPYTRRDDVPTSSTLPRATSSSSSSSSSSLSQQQQQKQQQQQRRGRLLPTLRAAEGEVAGALWALDGGELSYPRDGGGPAGWGVKLWRERALLRKEFAKMRDEGGGGVGGNTRASTHALSTTTSATAAAASPSLSSMPFSPLGLAARPASVQMDVEVSGAQTPGELDDWRRFPQHRYDADTGGRGHASDGDGGSDANDSNDNSNNNNNNSNSSHLRDRTGAAKPLRELATPVPASAELVWRGEARDALAAYKTDAELALESDNTFYTQLEQRAAAATRATAVALQTRQENDVDVVARGATRRSKYDYLAQWRDMYRHGTLDVPATPLLRFGRSVDDHHETMAASVRAWCARHDQAPVTDAQRHRHAAATTRAAEAREARLARRSSKQQQQQQQQQRQQRQQRRRRHERQRERQTTASSSSSTTTGSV